MKFDMTRHCDCPVPSRDERNVHQARQVRIAEVTPVLLTLTNRYHLRDPAIFL